jgi:hypothetical protein
MTLPSWFTNLTVGGIVGWTLGVVVVVALFAKVWRAVRPVWKGIRDFLEDWRGEPERDGVPGREGVMKRLHTIEVDSAEARAKLDEQGEKLDAIDHELHPNSGKSLRDEIDSISGQLAQHIAQQQG